MLQAFRHWSLSASLPAHFACPTCQKTCASPPLGPSHSLCPRVRALSDRPKPRQRTVFLGVVSQWHSSSPTPAQKAHRNRSLELSPLGRSASAGETISCPERWPHRAPSLSESLSLPGLLPFRTLS